MNRNLLLGEEASTNTIPKLEILVDEVRCSHGATAGFLDKNIIFYLMSRGLTHDQAERLVVIGFLGEVMQRLPLGSVSTKVNRVIEEKLRIGVHA